MIEEKKVYYKQFFYIFVFSNIAIFFILLFLTHGESASTLLYGIKDQMFMDFFNSLLQNMSNPYQNKVMYPPLSNCMYKFLLLFVPESVAKGIPSNETATHYGSEVLKLQQFMVPFIIYILVTTILLFFVLIYLKKGSKKEKLLFTVLSIFSGPMIFQFERANSIIVSFIFIILFFILYDSPNKIMREIGLLSLAVAVGLKIYPIVFIVFLMNRDRYKEFIRTIIYCILLFFVPMFILYGGIDGLQQLILNIMSYEKTHKFTVSIQLDFSKMIIRPFMNTPLSNDTLIALGDTFKYVISFSCGVAALFSKSQWKIAALCACLIYGFQGSCTTYLLIFFIIPAIMLLDSEKTHKKITYVYTFLLGVLVSGPAVINPITGSWSRYVGTQISSYVVLILTIMLVVSGVKDMMSYFNDRLSVSKKVSLLSFIVAIAVITLGGLLIIPGGIPEGAGFIFGLIDVSVIVSSVMAKNIILIFLAMVAFAGIIFLAWWLPRDDKYNGLRQFVKFGLVGVSNTFVSLAIYYIFYFIDPSLYVVGNAVGFIVSVLNAYILNSHFVFKSDEKKDKLKSVKELGKSYAVYGSTFLLSSVLIVLQVEVMGISGLIAPIINLLITIPLNYVLNKFWTYGEKSKKEN